MDAATTPLYRRALGAFATGVAVVTVEHAGEVVGLTVNSFTSVSLTPPLVLWCLGNASDRGRFFRPAQRFVVNILGAEDGALARRCAERGSYRILPEEVEPGHDGQPGIRGALTRLYCASSDQMILGDHLVIVGEVLSFDSRDGDGLTYFRGRYGRAVSPE